MLLPWPVVHTPEQILEEETAWRRQALAFSKQRLKRLPEKAAWLAWKSAHSNLTQQQLGEMVGGIGKSAVNILIRHYIEAHFPETLGRPLYAFGPPYIVYGDERRQLLQRHFAGKPEPPRPLQWIETYERRKRSIWYAARAARLGRPLDMGGPRDIWLEYRPGDPL